MRLGIAVLVLLCLVPLVIEGGNLFSSGEEQRIEDSTEILAWARSRFIGEFTCSQNEFELAMSGDAKLREECGLDPHSGIRQDAPADPRPIAVDHHDGFSIFEVPDFENSELDRVVAAELGANQPQVVLFDFSRNPGGWIEEAIELICLFVRDQSPILVRQVADNSIETNRPFDPKPDGCGTSKRGPYATMDIVVYVSKWTASAAELFIRALPHAIVVGMEPTYGKASMQLVRDFGGGKSLRITTDYLCASDRVTKCIPLHGERIEPDLHGGWEKALEKARQLAEIHPRAYNR